MSKIRLRNHGVTLDRYTKKLYIPIEYRPLLEHIKEIESIDDYNDIFDWVSVKFKQGTNFSRVEKRIRLLVEKSQMFSEGRYIIAQI